MTSIKLSTKGSKEGATLSTRSSRPTEKEGGALFAIIRLLVLTTVWMLLLATLPWIVVQVQPAASLSPFWQRVANFSIIRLVLPEPMHSTVIFFAVWFGLTGTDIGNLAVGTMKLLVRRKSGNEGVTANRNSSSTEIHDIDDDISTEEKNVKNESVSYYRTLLSKFTDFLFRAGNNIAECLVAVTYRFSSSEEACWTAAWQRKVDQVGFPILEFYLIMARAVYRDVPKAVGEALLEAANGPGNGRDPLEMPTRSSSGDGVLPGSLF